MVRRLLLAGGWTLAAAGFGLGLMALARPWARYRVTGSGAAAVPGVDRSGGLAVFQLNHGWWYVFLLLGVFGLLAAAVAGRGRPARTAGLAALVCGGAATVIAIRIGEGLATAGPQAMSGLLGTVTMHAGAGPGVEYGILAAPLVAAGAALLSTRTPVD